MLPEQLNDFFASGHNFQSTLSLDDQRGSRTGKGQHLFQVLHLQVFQAVLQDFIQNTGTEGIPGAGLFHGRHFEHRYPAPHPLIAGQAPVVTKSRKSIANFKVRSGMSVGCKVTLRGDRMYEFMDRLVNLALPRVRDFRGVSADSFDGRGNYALGLKEQLIFPEIEFDKVDKTRGMDVIFVTTAKTDEEARELLRLFNMPFQK